ncbi:uncharacterized protein LOC144621689 [Crassostrea virginica]
MGIFTLAAGVISFLTVYTIVGHVECKLDRLHLVPACSQRPEQSKMEDDYLAWSAARSLFKSLFSTKPKITQSGNRITKHFSKPGDYVTAVKDFELFKPADIQIINKNGQEGFYGDILDEKYTLTVRKTSSNGQPTLQLTPKKGDVCRKLRYICGGETKGTDGLEEQQLGTSQLFGPWY